MSSKNRNAKQVAKDRAALKRLRNSGTYKGKIDLRKPPTKYQLLKLKLIKGKKVSRKAAKKPLPPKPRIPDGMKLKRSRMTEKQVRDLKPSGAVKMVTYALPFLRKGQVEPEWRRFTGPALTKFLNEYKAGEPEAAAEWKSYAVKEEWSFLTKTERSEFKRETDLYFSGVRISEPKGGTAQKRKPNKKKHRGGKPAAKPPAKKTVKKTVKKAAKKPPAKTAKSRAKAVVDKVKAGAKKAGSKTSAAVRKLLKTRIW